MTEVKTQSRGKFFLLSSLSSQPGWTFIFEGRVQDQLQGAIAYYIVCLSREIFLTAGMLGKMAILIVRDRVQSRHIVGIQNRWKLRRLHQFSQIGDLSHLRMFSSC